MSTWSRMERRAFAYGLALLVAGLGAFCLSWPSSARQPALPRHIGVISIGFPPESKELQQFQRGLQAAGHVEGRDVAIEWRFANGDYDKVPEFVSDLIQRKVDVIVVDATVTTELLKRSTSTIPIVMAVVSDPLGSGFVASLSHPGGNITGLSMMEPELSATRLHLLKEALPGLTRVGVMWNPKTPYHPKMIQQLKAAAPSLSIQLSFVSVQTPKEFDSVLSALIRTRAQALYVIEDPFFDTHTATLSKLALKARLPAIYGEKVFAHDGGLMSYGPSYGDLFRRSAGYVSRILKGANPRDLPIEQPTKFELVVNLKTARALKLTIPQSILVRTDEVIR